MNRHYRAVADRAGHRCEYCHAPEVAFNMLFEVEHIVPKSAGGSNDESNLALACRFCNLNKGDSTIGMDPTTSQEVRLFHPRHDVWADHFELQSGSAKIRGLTAIGRATAVRLRMNDDLASTARQMWIALKLL